MRNKILFQGIAMLLLFGSAFAQTGRLTGHIKDEKGVPISFVSVMIRKQTDTSVISGMISDKTGKFSLATPAAGDYFVEARSVGYGPWRSKLLQITGTGTSHDLGTITLSGDAKQVKEVDIVAARPSIVQKNDRLVVNVEGSAIAAGNNALQVLSNLPGIYVDQNGAIQLNGRGGVTVMINNKLTYLSGQELRTLLESMPGANIKDVDIITNPSAKYDAEGASGILNINLKQNLRAGINGTVNSGINYNGQQTGYSGGFNINHRQGKFNSFVFGNYNHNVGGRDATFTRIFYGPAQTTFFDQVATGNNNSDSYSFRFGTDYSINKQHSISFISAGATQRSFNEFLTDTRLVLNPGSNRQQVIANNYGNGRFNNFTTNLHYGGKLDSAGTLLSADLDVVRMRRHSNSDFQNYYYDLSGGNPATQDFLFTDLPGGNDILSAKIDFSTPFGKGRQLEAGVKASTVTADNDSRFYFNNGPQPVPDPARTNHFIYKELIYAAYVNWQQPLGKKFSMQAGLRMEGTRSEGESITANTVNERDYINLFPSLFIQHNASENYQVNLNYSRRIQRPNYSNMNPFRFYRDPYTYEQGNPELLPQTTQSFGITQIIRKRYAITTQFQQVINTMSEVPLLDIPNATTIYTTGNIEDAYNFSIVANAPVKLFKFWDTNNTGTMQYNKFTMQLGGGQTAENKQMFFSFTSNHFIQLPGKTMLEIGATFRGPRASGLYLVHTSYWINAGLKRSFFKNKLDLSASVADIFRTNRLYFTTDIGGNINDFDQYFRARTGFLTLTYKFSKGLKTEAQRPVNLEEYRRAGGN